MRTNGTLVFMIPEHSAKAMFNDNGEPIQENGTWSAPLNVLITINKHNNRGTYKDGTFTVASYDILLECSAFIAERVRLAMNGQILGDYLVQSIQSLPNVGRIRVTV